MEHSLLHGLQVCGLVFALGGVLFQWLVLGPVLRAEANVEEAGTEVRDVVRRWSAWAATAGALAAGLDLFVQVAELDGNTIYAGVSLPVFFKYLTVTHVGRLALWKTLLLAVGAVSLRFAPALMALPFIFGAAVAATLVSHSAAVPEGRAWTVTAQLLHIVGAAFWLGMLSFIGLVTHRLERRGRAGEALLAALVQRFSPYALVSFLLVGLSGVYTAVRFIESPRAVLVSAYGLTLLLKVGLLGFAVYAGYLNWRFLRPALSAVTANPQATVRRFLRLVELEVSAGILLLLVAGILGAISPPTEPGSSQLTPEQTRALFSPRMPSRHLVDPAQFVGAATRTDDDLRYAEFTHQWSGAFVMVLGVCWLGQSLTWRGAKAFALSWPLLMFPFGCFISAIADPEVWLLHTYSLREVLSDPQVLEHQLGAVMVLAMAILGFRDGQRDAALRPLGRALPILMIVGSLMLLGHAHSNLGVSEELTNLINMQHAIIGSFGLIAGVSRWFQMRNLPGATLFRFTWPVCLIVLGGFMAFFYRELIPPVAAQPDYSTTIWSQFAGKS